MKRKICGICRKDCTGTYNEIHIPALSIFGEEDYDVCNSCLRDIRRYIRLKSKKSSKSKDTSDFDNDPSNDV